MALLMLSVQSGKSSYSLTAGYTLPNTLKAGGWGKSARVSIETACRPGRRNSLVTRTSENNASTEDSSDETVRDEEVSDLGVRAALFMLKFYKREISPLLLSSCRYVPTCSEYSMQAYRRYGVLKGTILTAWRLCRCNPFGGHGFDPPRWFGEEKPSAD